MRIIIFVALLLASMAAHAQAVYKCRDKAGKVEYTSWPCAKHQRTEKAVPAPPDPVRPYVPLAAARRAASAYAANTEFRAPDQRDMARERCRNAKAWREDELRRLGLKRTYNDLRRVDDWVQTQCAGV